MRNALHAASEKGHSGVAEFLLSHEGHVEAKDSEGNTPLCIATQHQQMDLVKLLLDRGADPDAENSVSNLRKNIFRPVLFRIIFAERIYTSSYCV